MSLVMTKYYRSINEKYITADSVIFKGDVFSADRTLKRHLNYVDIRDNNELPSYY